MLTASPTRHLARVLTVLPLLVAVACSDSPVAPTRTTPTGPQLLAAPTVTVTNTDDAGAGSLRQAIIDAAPGSVIQFDAALAGQTIVLSTGELVIDKQLTIEGPVQGGMTISGNLAQRIFTITGDAVLRNLTLVSGNEVSGGGGAAFIFSGTTLFDHVLVANNQAGDQGGAIYVKEGQFSLVNSTVSGNVGGSGGGIYSVAGTITIWNSTITNNSALNGGGINVSSGAAYLRNSLIAYNEDTDGGNDTNCTFDASADIQYAGRSLSNDDSCGDNSSMVQFDPILGPLANNGGPTLTHALGFGSAGIDLGTDCTETTDQRYVARNQGASCDAGAYEFDAFATATLKLSPNVALDSKTGVATVTGTITCPVSGDFTLTVALSQPQKTTGRFTTIVQGTKEILVSCTATTSWSAIVAPTAGKFQNGAASGQASARFYPLGYLRPADVTASLKVFQVK